MQDRKITIRTTLSSFTTLSLIEHALSIQTTKSSSTIDHEIPYRNVLQATLAPESLTLTLWYLTKKKKQTLNLRILQGNIEQSNLLEARKWVESTRQAAYEDIGAKRSRRLLVLVNPFGGTKKGSSIFAKKVEPLFKVAGCSVEVIHTTHRGHAYDIAKNISPEFDALITVSGDGLIHEVINGFANHANPMKAFAIPVAPIPTGSGNGLSLNLLGMEQGFDVVAAALNAIKGQPMKVDIFSLTQGGKRTLSFMSQALGLMADLDLGTEHLRWMGDTRFIYGLLKGLVKFKSCPIELSYKVAENDKVKMAANLSSAKTTLLPIPVPLESSDSGPDTLPPLKLNEKDLEDWTTFDEPILCVYAGKGPYVGRDFMAFPVSLPDDGLIDLMVICKSSRSDVLFALDGAPDGACFWHPKVHYVKAHSYRIRPLKKKGYFTVDGESYPFEEFQVEVHCGLATFLSPYGHYAARFGPRTPKHK